MEGSKVGLNDKIKTAMDESRMMMLGTQILLGFQFRGVFEKGFESLPSSTQYLKLGSLGILLIAVALIMWPGAYHRIVWEGNDSIDVHNFTTKVMDLGLLPFMLSLAIEFYAMTGKILGLRGGIIVGLVSGLAALFFWYGLGFISRRKKWDREIQAGQKEKPRLEMQPTKLHDKIEQALVEARMVLPGAQALLGFQFATMLVDAFDQLPQSSKNVHMISLGFIGLTLILLVTPAAYHRIVERGDDT